MSLHPRVLESVHADIADGYTASDDPSLVRGIHVERGEGSLGDLDLFPNLISVSVVAWSRLDLAQIVCTSPTLKKLSLWDADTADLTAVAGASKLRDIELRRCLVRDLHPLEQLPLRRLGVTGCPLDEASWRLRQKLAEQGARLTSEFPEVAWRMCRMLAEHGLAVMAFSDDYGNVRLSVPGLPGAAHGVATLTESQLQALLADRPDLDAIGLIRAARERS